MYDFKVFKHLSIGGLSKAQLIERLVDAGVQFNKYAHTLFEHPAFFVGGEVKQVQLLKVKVSALGISKPSVFQEIVNRASGLGMRPCPLSLGAFLRLEYLDQADGPYLTVASDRPEKDESSPAGVYLRNHDRVLWLRGYCASNDYEWAVDSEFIFLRDE